MATIPDIVAAMQRAAPPGCGRLEDSAIRELRSLTEALMAAGTCAPEEYARFLAIRHRRLHAEGADLTGWLQGRTVLVTGGTGCIGSTLMARVAAAGPRRLVCLSRGVTSDWPVPAQAEYIHGDLRDHEGLAAACEDIRPDVVFHLGAQRDPGLAEREVHRTVTTNVFGTRNVIAAAERCGVTDVVIASTGKALRPYTPEIYSASKRVVEWLAADAAARGATRYSAARFTHVVDNSIVHARLLAWGNGGVVRLHAPDIAFYAQSALESAELLLAAGLGSVPGGLRVHAITDLGWPVSLLDLALGVLMRTGSPSPIYFAGYEPGYESMPFPGLYDPATAGDLSPLLSAFEAPWVTPGAVAAVDAFTVELAPDAARADLLDMLEEVCETTRDPAPVRAALDKLSWSLFEGTMAAVPRGTLVRAAQVTAPYRGRLNAGQRRCLAAMERWAGESSS